MSTFKADIAAQAEYKNSLKDKVFGYMDQLTKVIDDITYPNIPTGTIEEPAKLGWVGLTLPVLTWPNSPELTYANLDRYKHHIWEAGYLDDAERILAGWVASGGVGISQAVQDATFNQDRERRRQSLADSLRILAANFGGRGHRIPNSILSAERSEQAQKYQFDDTESSRTIVKTISELAQKNVQFAMTQVTDIEKFHSDFSLRYGGLYINSLSNIIETYKADIQGKTAQLDATIRGSLAQLEAVKITSDNEYKTLHLRMTAEQNRLSMEMDRTKLLIDTINKKVDVQVAAIENMELTTSNMLSGITQSSISVYKPS